MALSKKLGVLMMSLISSGTVAILFAVMALYSSISLAKDRDDDHHHKKHHDADYSLRLLALKGAGIALPELLQRIQGNYTGVVVELELDDEQGQLVYEVELIDRAAGVRQELTLSLLDGSELSQRRESLQWLGFSKLDDEEAWALDGLSQSAFKLTDTITQLQQTHQAHVIDLSLENKKGITFYKFKLLSETGKQKILVDVASNEMIPVLRR